MQKALAVTLDNPLKNSDTFEKILCNVGNWLIGIAAPIAVFMVLIGAFQIMTSGGEPEKLNKGKKTILWTVVGYGILLIGWGIAEVIANILGGDAQTICPPAFPGVPI